MDGASPTAIAAAKGETPEPTIADDLLEGCPAIGAFIGKGAREALWAIERGWIPAWREGHKWCAEVGAEEALLRSGDQDG